MAVVLMTGLVGACASGGGDGVATPPAAPGGARGDAAADRTPPPVDAAFTSFSAVVPGQSVHMSGTSRTATGTAAGFNLDSVPAGGNDTSLGLSYDAEGRVSGVRLEAPSTSLSFGPTQVFPIFDELGRQTSLGANDGAERAAWATAVDPNLHGWDYQSFGVWAKPLGPDTYQIGAFSAGAPSPASALPLSSGTFTGQAGGFYFDSQGVMFGTDARMTAIADFQRQTVDFSTSGTVMADPTKPNVAPTPNSDLNLSGTLSYAPGGANRFSGNVTTQGLGLTGQASGQFYGPTAEEIGGTYGLSSPDGRRMLGGFGGKR